MVIHFNTAQGCVGLLVCRSFDRVKKIVSSSRIIFRFRLFACSKAFKYVPLVFKGSKIIGSVVPLNTINDQCDILFMAHDESNS